MDEHLLDRVIADVARKTGRILDERDPVLHAFFFHAELMKHTSRAAAAGVRTQLELEFDEQADRASKAIELAVTEELASLARTGAAIRSKLVRDARFFGASIAFVAIGLASLVFAALVVLEGHGVLR